MVYDKTKTYDATFYFAGGLIALSGVLIIPIRCVQVKNKTFLTIYNMNNQKW